MADKYYPGASKPWWDDRPFVKRKPVDEQVDADYDTKREQERNARPGVTMSKFFEDMYLSGGSGPIAPKKPTLEEILAERKMRKGR